MSDGIHFWSPLGPTEDELAAWDPDTEPSAFASGLGHNVLELVVRLRREGLGVTFGAEVPRGTRLLVLLGWLSVPARYRNAAVRAALRARGRVALIRSDLPLAWRFPVEPLVEFMPTRESATTVRQRWLPPLPQRGLVPRKPSRRGRIRSVAFKGNPESVPDPFLLPAWRAELEMREIVWDLDIPTVTDGSDQRWHDFSEIDCVLCLRRPDPVDPAAARKPATRLINAWRAGAVPLLARENGYRELAEEGQDAFFAADPHGVLAVIDRLNGRAELLGAVELSMAVRAEEFEPGVVTRQWRDALLEAARARDAVGMRGAVRSAQVVARATGRSLAGAAVKRPRRARADA